MGTLEGKGPPGLGFVVPVDVWEEEAGRKDDSSRLGGNVTRWEETRCDRSWNAAAQHSRERGRDPAEILLEIGKKN